MSVNATSAVNLLEAIRQEAPRARVVWVSTCEVYGRPEQLPVDEHAALAPRNPYAVSKAAADMLAGVYADAHGLQIIRPAFQPTPVQVNCPVRPLLARSPGGGGSGGGSVTGADRDRNPDTRRDFTDVRDVVRAYTLLAARADPRGVQRLLRPLGFGSRVQVELLGELLAPIEVEPRRRSRARARARGNGPAWLARARLTRQPDGSPSYRCASDGGRD